MSYAGGTLDAAHGPLWTTGTILGPRLRALLSTTTPASTAWPANNDAYAVPFLVSTPVTFVRAFFVSGTSPGTTNFDIGVYRDDFTLVASLGATAAVNTTDIPNPSTGAAFGTPFTLTRGRFFLAMSSASTGLTTRAATNSNQVVRALGMFKMATAHPLPDPFVPASMGTTAFIPTFGLMTAPNTIA